MERFGKLGKPKKNWEHWGTERKSGIPKEPNCATDIVYDEKYIHTWRKHLQPVNPDTKADCLCNVFAFWLAVSTEI